MKLQHFQQTTFRVCFSDPYSRQLLARRVVSRPKDMLKMRSELAFLLRLYLEPILMARGEGETHSIELLNLIKVLNLPPLASVQEPPQSDFLEGYSRIAGHEDSG